MMSCAEVLAELGNYLDDEVAADLRRHLERHVAECRTCRVLYDSTRKTLRLVTESDAFELPEGLSDRVLARFRASRKDSRGNGRT
jgi:anti-sigma factor (TIGR02949 family)